MTTKTISQTVKADGVRRFYSAKGGFLGEAKRVKFGEWIYSGPARQGTARTLAGCRRALTR